MKSTNFVKFGKGFLFLIYCVSPITFFAQKVILEQKLSIHLVDQKLDVALKDIANKGNFNISYNPDIFNIDSIVSISANSQSVRELLLKLLGEKITCTEKGNYLILKKSKVKPKNISQKKIIYTISGYVVDKQTGEKIPYASLYEQTTLDAAITDQFGFYQMQLPSNIQSTYQLNIRKENYSDTLIIVRPLENTNLDLSISPSVKELEIDSIGLVLDSIPNVELDKGIEENKLANFFLSVRQKFQSANMKQYFNRGWQISLLPGLSTNGILNSNSINNYSFNIIGGYSGGNKKLEIGGFINIDKASVSGLQMAGFSNLVGKNVNGLQLAGFSNTVLSTVKGAQFAGFTNIVKDTLSGAQFAGFCNIVKGYSEGIQAAGFCNVVTKNMSGVQLAGFSNITAGDSSNVQMAGFFNFSKNSKGCQAAGFMNVTAKKMEGVQMAGFLNYASEMNGFQIGIVNLSSQSNGIPIGLFSFSGNGFHKIEASYNDVLPINLAFKTGVKQFYNIFSAGYNPNPSKEYFSYGYGIGHEFTLNKKIGLDVELVSNQMNWKRWDELNLWNKANINLAWNIGSHFGLIAGPNLNFAITEKFRTQSTEVSSKNFIPENAFEVKNNSKNYITKGWIGFNVGLRFW